MPNSTTDILTREHRWAGYVLTREDRMIILRRVKGDFAEPVASFSENATAEEIRAAAAAQLQEERRPRRYWQLIKSVLGERIDPWRPPVEEGPQSVVEELLAGLTLREQTVLRLCFALDGKGPYSPTMEEVGRLIGVSKQRVNQIKRAALKKLREREKEERLIGFIWPSDEEQHAAAT